MYMYMYSANLIVTNQALGVEYYKLYMPTYLYKCTNVHAYVPSNTNSIAMVTTVHMQLSVKAFHKCCLC